MGTVGRGSSCQVQIYLPVYFRCDRLELRASIKLLDVSVERATGCCLFRSVVIPSLMYIDRGNEEVWVKVDLETEKVDCIVTEIGIAVVMGPGEI